MQAWFDIDLDRGKLLPATAMIPKAKDLEAPNVVIIPCGGTTFREKNRRLLYIAVSCKPSEGGRSCGQSESIRDIDLFVGTSAMDWQTSEVASPLPAPMQPLLEALQPSDRSS